MRCWATTKEKEMKGRGDWFGGGVLQSGWRVTSDPGEVVTTNRLW